MTQDSFPDWPGVSVVIPTWNGLALLTEYLPSVRAALDRYPGSWECLIVDDGGTDATARELPAIFPAATYVPRERNEGFSAAANTGFAAARHPCVLLLNNDIRVEPDFLRPLAERFRAATAAGDDELFAVVSLQINPAPTGDLSLPSLDGCRNLRFEAGELRMYATVGAAEGEAARPTALANGGCSLFSREKVGELGGFCAIFNPFYCEDSELSLQALLRGWRIVFEPASVVWHRPSSTTSQVGAINVVGYRNYFFWHWMLLDSVGRWLAHLAGVCGRVVVRTARGRTEYVRGLLAGLRALPELRRQRRERARGRRRSLGQVLAELRRGDDG